MRPLLPSVALVTAVFLLGCQEQGLSPVEAVDLEPQFGKPVPGEPTFMATKAVTIRI